MKVTAKDINQLIKCAGKCGLNVYAKTPESIVTSCAVKISKARSKDGGVRVYTVGGGNWQDLLDGRIYAR
jgi:hypothetical protein